MCFEPVAGFEIYDALCAVYDREFELSEYEKDVQGLVSQRILIKNRNYLEMRYNFGALPMVIHDYIIELMKEVEELKKSLRDEFKDS